MSWKQVISSEVLDIRDGTHDSPKYKETGYPLITSKNLKQGKIDFQDVNLVSEKDYNAINMRSKVDKGDILYSMIGSIGNYAFVDKEPDFAIKNVALFKFNDDKLHNRYFLHLLNSTVINRQIEKTMKGGTQKFVSLTILRNLRIPLPPLPEQKRIAAILDAADAYRQKTKALIDHYDALTQSLFLDMFGDPFDKNPSDEHDLVDFEKLTNRITYGFTNPMKHLEEGIPILTAKNIQNGYVDYENVHYADLVEFNELTDKSKPDQYDILITKDGSIGRTALLEAEFPVCINQSVALVKPKLELVNPKYLVGYLVSSPVQTRIQSMGKGGGLKHLQITELAKFPTVCPTMELQDLFAKRVQAIEAQRAQAQASLEKAENLFNGLLQQAFKGELTGTKAESIV